MEKEVYITTWGNKWITSNAGTIDNFISKFERLIYDEKIAIYD